jgi:hypothetical protein
MSNQLSGRSGVFPYLPDCHVGQNDVIKLITESIQEILLRALKSFEPSWFLQRVLDYVGPGHWFFLSSVSKLWRDLYERVQSQRMASLVSKAEVVAVSTTSKMTLFSSIFASPSRVSLANSNGYGYLRVAGQEYRAGLIADKSTLMTAHEQGLLRYRL